MIGWVFVLPVSSCICFLLPSIRPQARAQKQHCRAVYLPPSAIRPPTDTVYIACDLVIEEEKETAGSLQFLTLSLRTHIASAVFMGIYIMEYTELTEVLLLLFANSILYTIL